MLTGGHSASELELLVARQLGRPPAISFKVAVACEFGWPAVLVNLPVKPSGEPNPNLYYLACPWLRREVARLEDAGFIDELEQQLHHDPELNADTRRAQSEHSDEFRTALASRGLAAWQTGEHLIAGAREPFMLKCLHAHLAYYLAHQDYLLGRKIAAAIENFVCPDERCSAWMAEIRNEHHDAR